MRAPGALAVALVAAVALTGCSGSDDAAAPAPRSSTTAPASPQPAAPSSAPAAPGAPADPAPSILTMTPPDPVSLPALAQAEHVGGGLRLGAVRERTAGRTSYDVTYRSDDLRISGVLDVPRGRGPFPAVVLAHGHIEPSVYVRGQGMTRERAYLAERGYVALHVDYRNHAESSTDPTSGRDVDLGYAVDVRNAVEALRRTDDVPVADDRVALFGRSMGGAVVYNTLVTQPGLVQAASAWASNSTLEAQVQERWGSPDDAAVAAHGSPQEDPAFWRGVSSRTYLDQITAPVLVVQGGQDVTCPPRWARATHRALVRAGVEARLAWYPEEQHAFGPRFTDAMDAMIGFFREQGV